MSKAVWFLLVSILIGLVVTMHSCFEHKQEIEDPKTITFESIEENLDTLASDYFEGRKPFTRGEDRTVSYLVAQCESIGLEPINGNKYTQSVPLVSIVSTVKPVSLTTADEAWQWQPGSDIVINCPKTVDSVSIDSAELVFCGYGIVDESTGWNDYANADIEGKIAVVLVNDPGFGSGDSTFFKGEEMTYFGRWTYKYEEADRQGAKGLIIIHERNMAGYPWFVVESSWTGAQLALEREDDSGADIQGWIHLEAAKELFEKSGHELSAMIKAARKPGFEAVNLGATLSTQINNAYKKNISENVIAYIKGRKYPDEYIVYSAHWDHLGISKPVDGDSIYNGALDNACGVAALLGIAENFKSQDKAPERSVIFFFPTAEEQGLLGSEYFAKHPSVAADQMVANLNLDGCNPIGAMKDFEIIGYGQSEMDNWVAEELAKENRYVLPDQQPEKGYFFRSDHFHFAKIGVPCLFGNSGQDHVEKGKTYGKAQKDYYTNNHYHRPSDEYDTNTWESTGIQQDAQLYYNLGWKLANSKVWPKWKDGSEFAQYR